MEEQEIISKVSGCVATALGLDDDEVELDHILSTDLEAESIDYLDITFQLEKTFGITIDRDDLFPQKIFQDDTLVQGGKITDQGLAFLEEKLPFADIATFKKNPSLDQVPSLFTVRLLVNYVKTKLAA